MKRVEGLDYLRGLMAFSVMVYHYASYYLEETLGAQFLFGKLGIYAVASFYILSGLSLTLVYEKRIRDLNSICDYVIKRFFRIFPLFWIATTFFILLVLMDSYINSKPFSIDLYRIILNYSLLFGFIEPGSYITPGAWSIGNEIVFYLLFPFLLLSKVFFRIAIIISFLLIVYFSFYLISSNYYLSKQWELYINPFNQFFYFLSGCLIAKVAPLFKNLIKDSYWALLALIVAIVFLIYPVTGDKVIIVTGVNRLAFSILIVLLVLFVFLSDMKVDGYFGKALNQLGENCYAIYLLHPIIGLVCIEFFKLVGMNLIYGYIFAAAITLVISYYSFILVEKPMMGYGSALVKRIVKN